MFFTGSVALSGITSAGGVSFPSDIITAPFFNSHANQFKSNASFYNTQAIAAGFDSSGVTDMANDGWFLTKTVAQSVSGGSGAYFIDDDTDTRSAGYSSLLGVITESNIAATNVGIIWMCTNDTNSSGGETKAHHKEYLNLLIDFMKEDFPNIKKVFINPLHRNKNGGASDVQYQVVREAALEVIAENSFAEFGIETYDLDLEAAVDGDVHILDSVQEGEQARRMGKRVAGVYKKGPITGTIGPQVTAATWETDHALLTVSHDDGSDITVPSGSEECFAFDIDGTVYQASATSRVDATTIKVDFDNVGFFTPDTDDSFKVGYGAMNGLSRTSPEVVVDNATNALPLRLSVITPTISDPLLSMDFDYDLSPKAGVRTDSSGDITQITERGGNTFISASGNYATYSSSNGSLVAPDATTAYYLNSSNTGSAEHLVFLAFFVPSTIANQGIIWGAGSSASVQPTPRTSLILNTSGNLQWYQNQSSGVETLGSATTNAWNIVCLDFQSTSNADAYINSTSTTHTFDPRDNMPTQTVPWVMAGDTDASANLDGVASLELARCWGRFGASHGEAGDASISDIMTYLAGNYGATLS